MKTEAIGLRVLPELKEKIKQDAKKNNRSLSQQVAWIIERHFEKKD